MANINPSITITIIVVSLLFQMSTSARVPIRAAVDRTTSASTQEVDSSVRWSAAPRDSQKSPIQTETGKHRSILFSLCNCSYGPL